MGLLNVLVRWKRSFVNTRQFYIVTFIIFSFSHIIKLVTPDKTDQFLSTIKDGATQDHSRYFSFEFLKNYNIIYEVLEIFNLSYSNL